MSVRARYKTLRQAKARLVKAMEAALWRRKDWEDRGPDPADSSGRRRLWRWQGAPPAGGKVPRPRTQIRKPGTGRGARTTQETTPMSEQSQNTPIRGQQRTVQMGGFRGPMSRETLMPEGVSKAAAWRRTDDPQLFAELLQLPSVRKQLRGMPSIRILHDVGTAILHRAPSLLARQTLTAFTELASLNLQTDPRQYSRLRQEVHQLATEAVESPVNQAQETMLAALRQATAPRRDPRDALLNLLSVLKWSGPGQDRLVIDAIRKELPNPFARKPAVQQVDPVAYRNRAARQSVEAALDDDIANGDARRVLADLEEEEGREGLAAVHRQLIDLQPYGPLTQQDRQAIRQAYLDHVEEDDEDDPVRITENYDPELRAWYFQVDRESGRGGDPVRYLVCQKRGDVDYDRLRNLADR